MVTGKRAHKARNENSKKNGENQQSVHSGLRTSDRGGRREWVAGKCS